MVKLNELIENHLKAMGGKDKLNQVDSIRMIGDREEGGSLLKDFEVVRAKPNKLRVSIMDYSEGFSGEYSWENNGGEKKKVEGVANKALIRAANWPGLFRTWEDVVNSSDRVELIENDSEKAVVEITLEDGYRREYHFNKQNYLIEFFKDIRPLHPGEKIRNIGTKNSDFRKVNGILMSFRSEEIDLESNEVVVKRQWNEITINPNLENDFFELR